MPTVFVYQLVDGQYQVQAFRGDERVISKTFPELELTVNQIVAASKPKFANGENSIDIVSLLAQQCPNPFSFQPLT